jgi:SAM-dependent methyltransferase
LKVCLACEARFDTDDWHCPECGNVPTGNGFLRFFAEDLEQGEGFPESSFAQLPEQEARSFWFAGRNQLIAWALGRWFRTARSFFELGCGTGVVLGALRECRPDLALAGGEPFTSGLEVARSRLPGVPLYQLDGRRLPFEEEFDVVGAFDVLEHIEEDEQVLEQMHQAAKPGGGILVSVPQHPWLWSAVDDFSLHRRRYTKGELVRKIEAAGFEVTKATSFVSLLLPAVALSRWRHRADGVYDPSTEYGLPQVVERLFGTVMAAERRLITLGVSFPVGSSLLVAARRR